MKRSSNLISLLVVLMLFSAAGCSQEYQSERHLYRATIAAKDILINPEAIPPQEFNRAVNAYKTVFERYPDTWCARRARLAIGSLYIAKKDYLKARGVFKEVVETYPDNKDICLEARFNIAKSYESDGNWNNALLEYKGLIRDYPDTEAGLSLPMYVAQHYHNESDMLNRDSAYMDAVVHYKRIAEENSKSLLGYKAENLIAMCYVKQDLWHEALEGLEKLVMDYPMARNLGLSMRMIADIAVNRLDNPQLAIEIFERFLVQHPGHALKDNLEEGLEALKDVSAGE